MQCALYHDDGDTEEGDNGFLCYRTDNRTVNSNPEREHSRQGSTLGRKPDHAIDEEKVKEMGRKGEKSRAEDVELRMKTDIRKREEDASRREKELDRREEEMRRKEEDIVPRWTRGKETQVEIRKRMEELRAREVELKGREAAVLLRRAERGTILSASR
jgi:hypothetical protein